METVTNNSLLAKISKTDKMKLKQVLAKFFFNEEIKPDENKLEDVIAVDDTEGRKTARSLNSLRSRRKLQNSWYSFFVNVVMRCLFCLLWAGVFCFFVWIIMLFPFDNVQAHKFIYLSCFVIVLTVSIMSVQFENLFVKCIEKIITEVDATMRQKLRKSHILRIRKAGGSKEFIETEVESNKLTYEDVLQVCCEELNVEKEKVKVMWKVPQTKIRGDADIKRFQRYEYLEIHTD